VQGQTSISSFIRRVGRTWTGGNDDELLGVREGNNRSFPSDAGTSSVLPGMLPVTEVRRRRRRL